jgi:hypothetical protein
MTPEQLAVLKEVAERATEKHPHPEGCRCMRDFERAFRPATCKALLEEVERLTKAVKDLDHDLNATIKAYKEEQA